MDRDGVCEPERAGGVRDGGAGRDAGRADGGGDGGERAGGVDVDGRWERVRGAVHCAVGGGDEPHDRSGDAGGRGGDAVRVRELVGQWSGVAHGDGARDGDDVHGVVHDAVFSDDGGEPGSGWNDLTGERVEQRGVGSGGERGGEQRVYVQWI